MVEAQAETIIDCSPEECLKFVVDLKQYSLVDDKVRSVSWTRSRGSLTTVKYRPRLPGSNRWEPNVIAQLRNDGAGRIDVGLAPFPRNAVNHLLGEYRASFSCQPANGKTLVTRTVTYRFRPWLRRVIDPRLAQHLQRSIRRELVGVKAALEGQTKRHAQVIIVGAGLSGIAAAVKLREAGITDLLLLEKSDRVGGTWRDNTYPGCAVDIPSAVYSFSFDPNPDWSRVFVGQEEILSYIERAVAKYGLTNLLRGGTELLTADWRTDRKQWLLTTTDGEFTAQHVIFATGLLHEPKLPPIPGLEGFDGPAFHSARWDPEVDLSGKRVAVVGTGCSAVQIVPAIQPQAAAVYVFQRTASWVLPRPDVAIPNFVRRRFQHAPWLLRVVRALFDTALSVTAFMMRDVRRARLLNPVARWALRRQVCDPRLRAAVTPSFTVGCKRLIMSNDYYPALCADNVKLIPHALAEVRNGQAVDAEGGEYSVDVIVLASGFELRNPPIAARIRGRDGRLLSETWTSESPRAYRGTTVPNVPNGYFLLGPNIVMYNSLLTLAEWQISYIIGAVRSEQERDIGALEVRSETFEIFNRSLGSKSVNSTYDSGGCSSFYIDENGRNFVTYPWSAKKLRRSLKHFDSENYWAPAAGDMTLEPPEPTM